MATAVDPSTKAQIEPPSDLSNEGVQDLLTFNKNDHCRKAYETVKEKGILNTGKNLKFLFTSHTVNEARYYINKLNIDFTEHFEFKLTPSSESQRYVLTLFFKPEAKLTPLTFIHKKAALHYPTSIGLENKQQNCYVNTALQCLCGFLYHNPMLEFVRTHLPIEYTIHAILSEYSTLEDSIASNLVEEIQSKNLVNLAAYGFTSTIFFENPKKPYKIGADKFRIYSEMINSLIELTSTLNSPSALEQATQARERFISSYAKLLVTHKFTSCFIETDKKVTWEFKRRGNATAVITEIISTTHLNGLHDNFNLLKCDVIIKNGMPNIGKFSKLKIIDVVACLPKNDKNEQSKVFSLDNLFMGTISEDMFAPSETDIPVTWFMCKTPPEKLLVKLSESILKGYTAKLTVQVQQLIKLGSVDLYGILPLVELLKNNLHVKVPLYMQSSESTVKHTYTVDHVICNSDRHYSTLKFTQQGQMIHIDDSKVKPIILGADNKAAIKYVIKHHLCSSIFSLHRTPSS